VSILEGTFPKKKEGTNPKVFFCVNVVIFSVLGHTIRICIVCTIGRGGGGGRDFQGSLWHKNRGIFWISSCCCWAVLCMPYNTLLGIVFEAHI
jgi:hypothetical protein